MNKCIIYVEEYTLVDKELFMFRTFIEALGYEKQNNGIWKINFNYNMPEQTYEDYATIDEEELKAMTINDAMLCAIDTKRAKEAELEFKMKYDIETPKQEIAMDESIKSFIQPNRQVDCPNCL